MSSEHERPFTSVSRQMWQRMLRIGRDNDINQGGYCDARSGVVNFWVGPADHPPSWCDVPITTGALDYPREFLGGVGVDFDGPDDGMVHLCLSVSPYQRKEAQKLRGPAEALGLPDEWDWVNEKARWLLEQALKEG